MTSSPGSWRRRCEGRGGGAEAVGDTSLGDLATGAPGTPVGMQTPRGSKVIPTGGRCRHCSPKGPSLVSVEPSSFDAGRGPEASTNGPGTNRDRRGPMWWRTSTVQQGALHPRGRRFRVTSRVTGSSGWLRAPDRQRRSRRRGHPLFHPYRDRVARPADRPGDSFVVQCPNGDPRRSRSRPAPVRPRPFAVAAPHLVRRGRQRPRVPA